MGAKSKAAVPEDVLRSVFTAGLIEIRKAGIEARVGNTGTSLIVTIDAWRVCSVCGQVVQAGSMATAVMCQKCAQADVPVLAQGDV